MRIMLQRVVRATVSVDGETLGEIGKGFVLLLGVGPDDTDADADFLAEKCAHLRIFEDSEGKMNFSALDVGGEALVISQFTLYGDCRKGRRPSFTGAAPPDRAERLYQTFMLRLQEQGLAVRGGRFGARMLVEIWNDGPVTFLLESP
jgi:D-tyrosyl-tRNA(Tyr) deacylase